MMFSTIRLLLPKDAVYPVTVPSHMEFTGCGPLPFISHAAPSSGLVTVTVHNSSTS